VPGAAGVHCYQDSLQGGADLGGGQAGGVREKKHLPGTCRQGRSVPPGQCYRPGNTEQGLEMQRLQSKGQGERALFQREQAGPD
ncbi:hypothetical protein AJOOGB_AJOOGB_07970, partial [Dysosmobacter welbionis]